MFTLLGELLLNILNLEPACVAQVTSNCLCSQTVLFSVVSQFHWRKYLLTVSDGFSSPMMNHLIETIAVQLQKPPRHVIHQQPLQPHLPHPLKLR